MNWLNYLLQVNFYLILFYGFYRILLRTETFFNLNRGYLVASAALAFFVPLMQSEWVRSWFVTEQISQTITTFYDPQIFYVQASEQAHTLTIGDFMAFLYIVGILIGIARFGGNLVFLGKLMKQKIVQKDSKQAFSFFNMLFVSKELKNRSTIMKHEFVHIRQLHSADVMLFELIAIFNWFNPVVYLYKSSVKHIHEFIADEIASRNEASKAEYAMLLFQEQFGVQAIPLTNNFFNQSLLKLRIKMLQKERSSQTAMMKYGLIAPLFVLMIVVSSATLASKQLNKIEEKVEELYEENLAEVIVKPSETVSEALQDENIDLSKALIISPELVDEVKTADAFKKYLQRNLRYPLKAQKELITGMSYIGFTVNNSGKILNIKTLKEKSNVLSEEVKRVLESIDNANTLNLNEPNDYVISVNFGLEVSKGNGTRSMLSTELITNFEGRKKLDDIVVIGYTEDVSRVIKQDTSEIFDSVEENPEFVGGMEALGKFLQENLKYPEAAKKANFSGKVYTSFIVNADGTATNFDVLKSAEFGCNEEALRVLKLVPKWIPGKSKGKVVRSRFIVPINFTLEEEKMTLSVFATPDNGKFVLRDKLKMKFNDHKNYIYYFDDKEITEEEIKGIDPSVIDVMTIFKGDKAVAKYGEKGRNGVLVITSKKK